MTRDPHITNQTNINNHIITHNTANNNSMIKHINNVYIRINTATDTHTHNITNHKTTNMTTPDKTT